MSLPNRSFNPIPLPFSSSEWVVPLSAPSYSDEEVRAVSKVLRSGWWTFGPVARQLEADFAAYLGVRHAIAVSSGTAALHLAHVALGLGAGDEVVTPSLNFVAAANTILHAGGTPRFADVASLDCPLVTVETLELALTPKTRGICLMHYGGYPCPMDAVMDFAHQRGLWVIEDAAHAPGASWRGKRSGTWGDVACFSFFGNKNLTCAEGGMVVTQSDDLAEKLRALRSHGMSSLTWERYKGPQFSYDVTVPGFNYRMDDIRAALLRAQLHSLDRLNRLRQERVRWYRELLGKNPRWIVPFENYEGRSAYHLFVVVLAAGIERARVMGRLRNHGIQTSIHYPPIHQLAFFRKLSPSFSDLKKTEDLGQRLLTLPLYPAMTWEEVKLVSDALIGAVGL